MLDQQEEFVGWWREKVARAGGDRQTKKHSPRSAGMLSLEEAEKLTGISSQQISKWAKRLAKRADYAAALYGVDLVTCTYA
jgi:hypothetical protein